LIFCGENILITGSFPLIFLMMEIKQMIGCGVIPSIKKVCQHHSEDRVITRIRLILHSKHEDVRQNLTGNFYTTYLNGL
jgi:hypothetical protein